MDDPALVQVADRVRDFLDHPAELLDTLRLPGRQRLPAGIAREQAQAALVLGQRHEVDDPRVVEVSQERGLALQLLGGASLLDSHQLLPVQLGVKGHIRETINTHGNISKRFIVGQRIPIATGAGVRRAGLRSRCPAPGTGDGIAPGQWGERP